MGSHVTPAAIRSKSLFSFDPHGAFIENPRGIFAMRGGCWRVRAASARQRCRFLRTCGSGGARRLLSLLRDRQ